MASATLTINGVTLELHPAGPRAWRPVDANEFFEALTSAVSSGELAANDAQAVSSVQRSRFRVTTDGRMQLSVNGGRYQTLGRAETKTYNILDYGADPTGVAASDTAVQEAIDAAIDAGAAGVYAPTGTYKFTSGPVLRQVYGFSFFGDGPHRTKFTWAGSSGADVLTVENCQLVNVHDFEIKGNTAAGNRPRSCLFSSFDVTDYAYITGRNNFYNLWLGGVSGSSGLANQCQQGVRIATKNTDFNNSEHLFSNVHVDGCSTAGIYIDQTQAKTLKFYDCHVNYAGDGVNCVNGAFSWYGGSIASSDWMFKIGAPNDPILIEGLQSEGCARIYQTGAGVFAGASHPTTIRNCRLDMSSAHSSGEMIWFGNRGPLLIENNLFDSWVPVSGTPLQFVVQSSIGKTAVTVRNNAFNGSDSYLHSCIKDLAAIGVEEDQNIYIQDSIGAFYTRAHAGTIDMDSGDGSSYTHTFDIPVHTMSGGAVPYSLYADILSRGGGATQTISSISKTTTGFTITLSGALTAGQTLSIDWQLRWK